jgi:spoIIIJ-associated protein
VKLPFDEDENLESLEVTARTVAEAIEKALTMTGKTREELDVSVLSEGSRGILGIGSEDARILVSPRELVVAKKPRPAPTLSAAEVGEIAQEVVETLLAGMRITADVDLKPVPPAAAEEGFIAHIDIVGAEDVGILIGRRGETLGALQFLTTLIVSKKAGHWSKLLVDVEGYRPRREASLRSLATRVAQRVQQTRQPMALEAMPPNERRIVHLALQDHPAVTTTSTGEGEERHVIVQPRR